MTGIDVDEKKDICKIQKEGTIRKWIIENNWIEKIIHIKGNTFVDTKIATCVIVFNKAKENQEILFVDGEKQKSISLKEIAEKRNGEFLL